MNRNNISIFFDEEKHKYTDSNNRKYTSVTTVIGYYENKFDEKKYEIAKACERIGQNPKHPKYPKYVGKTVDMILAEWEQASIDGCTIGNSHHNYLDSSVKLANGYRSLTQSKFTGNKIYTINDILNSPTFGRVDLDYFEKLGVKDRYPKIFNTISYLVEQGYLIYSEICTFDSVYNISGLIDILAIKGNKFIIIDWKTNKAPLMYKSGYFEKDLEGNLTDVFIENDDKFKFPLHKYPQSIGHKYTFQLSLYDFLTEQFGLECIGNLLCHIRHNNYLPTHSDAIKNPTWIDKQQVDIYPITYLKNDMIALCSDFNKKLASGYIDGINIRNSLKAS